MMGDFFMLVFSGRVTYSEFSGCCIPASFSTTFLKYCGRGESLRNTTCAETVVGGKQRHAPCNVRLLHEVFCSCQSDLMEIIRLLINMR